MHIHTHTYTRTKLDRLPHPDINECAESLDNCHADAICRNTVGSFECTCRNGFTGNGVICNRIICDNEEESSDSSSSSSVTRSSSSSRRGTSRRRGRKTKRKGKKGRKTGSKSSKGKQHLSISSFEYIYILKLH